MVESYKLTINVNSFSVEDEPVGGKTEGLYRYFQALTESFGENKMIVQLKCTGGDTVSGEIVGRITNKVDWVVLQSFSNVGAGQWILDLYPQIGFRLTAANGNGNTAWLQYAY